MWLFIEPLRHREARVPAARAALLGREERQVDRVGDEVRVEKQALLLALVGEVLRLAVEALLEVVLRVEDEARCRRTQLMITGALVTATKRAASLPEPLKCWCWQLSGIAKIAPAFHSKLTRLPASFQTAVEPRPSRT